MSSLSEQAKTAGEAFAELTATVELLRDPGGCPWDAEQTHISLRPNLLEETYETLEAIDSGDSGGLAEELGVTFLFAKPDEADNEEYDWRSFSVPLSLYEGLVSAVATHSITDLRKSIDALELVGEKEGQLAKHLRTLSRQFDMEQIQNALGVLEVREG